jgi:chemotaxis protein methyltransferase CheR
MSAAAAENATGEFEFCDADFERVRKLIYSHAGISLSTSKRQLVYSRLGRRLRTLGLSNFGDYLDDLESGGADEWEAFTNALTTNLTSFFRESHHFPILAEHVAHAAAQRTAVLWCSACSTGEEPYSMAMTVMDALGSMTPSVRILATDVDTNVLAKAQRGVYPAENLDKLPANFARKFLIKGTGENAGQVKIRPEVQRLISFRPLNLLHDSWPIRGPLDAIFCRNVMIYFDKPTQYSILKKFAPLLREDGLLFAGHSESFHNAADLFRLRGKTVYGPVPPARGGRG